MNAIFEGVTCPDFIREQWRERLIIDLDPSYPLDLTFEEEGLGADLSFGGYVTRCSFPYGAVYVVADRSTGRGIVLDQNMPDSVKRTRYGRDNPDAEAEAEAAAAATAKPSLRPVATEAPALAEDTEPDESTEKGTPPPAEAAEAKEPAADTEQVQKRRAAFRVIDGGS